MEGSVFKKTAALNYTDSSSNNNKDRRERDKGKKMVHIRKRGVNLLKNNYVNTRTVPLKNKNDKERKKQTITKRR